MTVKIKPIEKNIQATSMILVHPLPIYHVRIQGAATPPYVSEEQGRAFSFDFQCTNRHKDVNVEYIYTPRRQIQAETQKSKNSYEQKATFSQRKKKKKIGHEFISEERYREAEGTYSRRYVRDSI